MALCNPYLRQTVSDIWTYQSLIIETVIQSMAVIVRGASVSIFRVDDLF
jgi:hypothetical protein